MTVYGNGMSIIAGKDDYPNVVRLNIPSDHHTEGAAWIFVPSKETIYVGPPGSANTTLDLLEAVDRLVDKKKGEKMVTGVLYDDGYSDIYTSDVDTQDEGKILYALQNYHSQYYDEDENFRGEIDNGYMNYPTEDDTAFDPEDDVAYKDQYEADEIFDPETQEWITPQTHKPEMTGTTPSWFSQRDYGKGDYSIMKPTPGVEKPISEWRKKDYLRWRDEGRRKNQRGDGLGYYGFGSTREDYNHWRWSYGDSNLVTGPPHEGLWLWPTENGYPDHFSQTGSDGLGNCAQGRVYPHAGNRWEILTWPDRPRNVKDYAVKKAIQHAAQQAVKRYLMEKINVPEDKIFFTEGGYGPMVSYHNSESYPDRSRSPYKSYPSDYSDSPDYEDIDAWLEGHGRGKELVYDDTDASEHYITYDPYTQTMKGTGVDNPKLMQKVVDHLTQLKNKSQGFADNLLGETVLTPEEKWEQTLREHEAEQSRRKVILPSQAPEGTTYDPNGRYVIHKNNGKTTIVSPQDYELAVEEYGDEHWWLAFVSPKEVNDVTSIEKEGSNDPYWSAGAEDVVVEAVARAMAEATAAYGEQPDLKNWVRNDDGGMDYVGSTSLATIPQQLEEKTAPKEQTSYGETRGNYKTDAFVWLGFGYGPDAQDIHMNPIVETGTTHWTIVKNKLLGKSEPSTIAPFLKKLERGEIDVPMLWGWVTRSSEYEGLVVTFMTHLVPMKQDLEYIPQALAGISNNYNLPIKDYDIEDSQTPILESYTPKGVEGTGPPQKAPPLPSPDPTSGNTTGIGDEGKVLANDEVGYVRIVTEKIRENVSGGVFKTFVHGGELDGSEFTNYTEADALQTHNWLLKDEHRLQQTEKRMTTGAANQFSAVEVDPGPDATHSDKERPFIYYPDDHTLYYTTTYCHHAHIVPKIVAMRAEEGHSAYGGDPISGDITDPDWNERNWIKFINGDHFPTDVIDFLIDKFGKRDIMYSGPSGYELAAPHQFYIKQSFNEIDSLTPREDRVKEWRWSYDPDYGDFKVWEVKDGYPSHSDITGYQGPFVCVQGRIYLLKDDKVELFFWKNRPMSMTSGPEKTSLQEEGWDKAWEWVKENGIGEYGKMTPVAKVAKPTDEISDIMGMIKWGWYCAYSPKINAAGHVLVTYTINAMNKKLEELGLTNEAVPFAVGTLNGNIIVKTPVDVNPNDQQAILSGVQERWGMKAYTYEGLIEAHEKGTLHQMFLPSSGCFGFVNGNLILGQRHHQEIMYRLLQNGWTWEDLLNAPQCWGWFSNAATVGVRFSSDAGIMTSEKVKTACKAAFSSLFNKDVTETAGYGGKSKSEFGGNFKDKYGDPLAQDADEMVGYKAQQNDTVLSPLPPPPAKGEEEPIEKETKLQVIPGDGIQPPKKIKVGIDQNGPIYTEPFSVLRATNIAPPSSSKRVSYRALDDDKVAEHVWKWASHFEKLPVR